MDRDGRARRIGVVFLGVWLTWSGIAGATDFYWTNNTTGGNFTNAANWFTNGALATTFPGASDNANFTNVAIYQVNWTSSVTNNNAFFNSATTSTVTVAVGARVWWLTNSFIVGQNANTIATVGQNSGTILVTNDSASGLAVIGDSGRGTLVLSLTSRVLADQMVVGRNAGSVGTMTLTGGHMTNGLPSAAVTNLIVGASGSGTFTQSSGTNSIANLAIVGLNAGGTGTMTQTGGLRVLTNAAGTGTLLLGAQSGAVGIYTLNGAGASFVVDNLVLATNAGSAGTFNWTAGALTVNSLGVNATSTNAILQSLIGTSLGSNSSQTVTYGVSPDLVFNNGLILGETSTGAGAISMGGGTFAVTNASGNAALVVGKAGKGTFTVAGGAVTVDQLLATNVTGGATNSSVLLNTGTLNILGGSKIVATNNFNLGGGGTVFVNILGGTNVITAPGNITFGNAAGTDRAIVTVSGPGTLWSNNAAAFNIGFVGANANQLVISNGAHVVTPAASLNANLAGSVSSGNRAIVTDSNSLWDISGALIVGGRSGNNQLIITNGGVVNSLDGTIGVINSTAVTNNSVVVSGTGSRWNMGGTLLVGQSSDVAGTRFNSLKISDGGVVTNLGTAIGGNTGAAGGGFSNNVLVTGAGSLLSMSGDLFVGYHSSNSFLIISDGGRVSNLGAVVGRLADSFGNTVVVTGPGSFWQNLGTVLVGSNGTSSGNSRGREGLILVKDGGTLEGDALVSGFLDGASPSGVISNSGGIYQFTRTNVSISALSANSIVINSGTISFRGVTNANVFGNSTGSQLTNMTFLGDNRFRLNGSSNAPGVATYTFATGNPTNYAGLELVNNSTLWRSTTLNIGGSGRLLVSNTTATIAASLTSAGSIDVVNSKLTLASNAVISGGYRSDPSTNTFQANATVTSSGFLSGSTGDLFVFERNLINQSASNTWFDLQFASVLFTNGVGTHILESPGVDNGDAFSGIANVTDNFAFGLLTLSSVDSLRVTGSVGRALYVGALDFGGLSNTNNLFLDINLYYDSSLTANSYLGGQSYDLQGAGDLLPYPGAAIPEPSVLGLFLTATLGLACRRRNHISTQT